MRNVPFNVPKAGDRSGFKQGQALKTPGFGEPKRREGLRPGIHDHTKRADGRTACLFADDLKLAAEETAAVIAAAAAEDQDQPYNVDPASAVVMFEASAVSAAAAAKDQDQPDQIASVSSCPASASTVATAVCSRYITHDQFLHIKCLITMYHMWGGLAEFPEIEKNMKM